MLASATTASGHLFWIGSRAAGIGALLLSSASVSAGLMQSRWAPRRWAGELRSAHEALSIATLVAIGVHGLSLLGDGFLAPSLADLTIPFVSPYQRIWTTLGIVAAWMLALLGLSYYARARIGVARWRQLHRLTAVAWVSALVHSLAEGSDAGEAWFLAATAIAVLPTIGLLGVRHLTPQQRATA
jgi:sulfoxide reductase heme-binding subunit YedZ